MVVPTIHVSFYFFYDFKSYFSERNFAAVPTFKELICKVQIPTLHRTHVKSLSKNLNTDRCLL
ncbi:hypothetical protein L9Z41_04830 [Leptospira noguchii]|uniref:hypothetical protein n=1 Tax=Leptospira noguchii TaxID=28182 RepID=UPI001F06F217|nr:hypothetical protein [Leptospira noguchii]MCH1914980.1 hypothetical protein [Leptospira noguchii]UOG64865.1 hypothetical protein MAL04_04925 [Leptospira noguchii]UOG64895.1 hypothetical protein MAL04_05160 [Leptospira noguchii]